MGVLHLLLRPIITDAYVLHMAVTYLHILDILSAALAGQKKS